MNIFKSSDAYKASNDFDLELYNQLTNECEELTKLATLCLSYNQSDDSKENKYDFSFYVYTIGLDEDGELVPMQINANLAILPFNTEKERNLFMLNFENELKKVKRFLSRK